MYELDADYLKGLLDDSEDHLDGIDLGVRMMAEAMRAGVDNGLPISLELVKQTETCCMRWLENRRQHRKMAFMAVKAD